jgi:hypothetical protein
MNRVISNQLLGHFFNTFLVCNLGGLDSFYERRDRPEQIEKHRAALKKFREAAFQLSELSANEVRFRSPAKSSGAGVEKRLNGRSLGAN